MLRGLAHAPEAAKAAVAQLGASDDGHVGGANLGRHLLGDLDEAVWVWRGVAGERGGAHASRRAGGGHAPVCSTLVGMSTSAAVMRTESAVCARLITASASMAPSGVAAVTCTVLGTASPDLRVKVGYARAAASTMLA